MTGRGVGVEEAVTKRVRYDWCEFKELYLLLAMRVPLKLKGKICKACVQSVLLYGSETWAMKVEDMNKLERAEISMMRLMCDVNFKDRKSSQVILSWLEIDPVSILVKRGRLRWFRQVERKDKEDWVSACRDIKVDGTKDRGAWQKNLDGVHSE